MNTTITVIIIVAVLAIAGIVASYFFKKRNMEKLYTDAYENVKKVPKKKKKAFLLLMFREAMAASKKKGASQGQLNNPKYLEIQMLQMSKALKDPEAVSDKFTKRALTLLTSYLKWEEEKIAESKKSAKEAA